MRSRLLFGLSLGLAALALVAWQLQTYLVYMPVVMKQPTPTPTVTPTPTITPTPIPCQGGPTAATQFFSSRGVQGNLFRWSSGQSNCVQRGEEVRFDFKVTNTNPNAVRVGGLGAIWCVDKPGGECTQASWGDFDFAGTSAGGDNNVIEWDDGLRIPTSGTYQVRLGICWLGSRTDCENNPGQWEYLSNAIVLVVR